VNIGLQLLQFGNKNLLKKQGISHILGSFQAVRVTKQDGNDYFSGGFKT
jgi:hypothetical protein